MPQALDRQAALEILCVIAAGELEVVSPVRSKTRSTMTNNNRETSSSANATHHDSQ